MKQLNLVMHYDSISLDIDLESQTFYPHLLVERYPIKNPVIFTEIMYFLVPPLFPEPFSLLPYN